MQRSLFDSSVYRRISSISWKVNPNTRFFISNAYLTFDIRAMNPLFERTCVKSFSMLSHTRTNWKWEGVRVKEKKERGSRRIRGRDRGIWVDNEKCSCHLLEQTSASERDFKITFTRSDLPRAGGRIQTWKFHFHNLQGGSLSPDVSRGYILCSFPRARW